MPRFKRYIFALITLLFCFAPSQRSYANLQQYPHRIISLTPGVTEILFALGLGDKVVGDTTYCDYPPVAKSKPHVGDVATNYEAVLALHPDLVIVDQIANAQAVPRLRALHLPLLLIQAKSLNDVERNIETIGNAAGALRQANAVVAMMKSKVKQAQQTAAEHRSNLRTLIIVGDNPLYVAGPQSFVGAMVSAAGAKNIVTGGFTAYSKETAIAANPQVIFCERDEADVLRRDAAWSQTTAVKRGNVFSIDANILYRPGPRLADGLVEVATALAHARQ